MRHIAEVGSGIYSVELKRICCMILARTFGSAGEKDRVSFQHMLLLMYTSFREIYSFMYNLFGGIAYVRNLRSLKSPYS